MTTPDRKISKNLTICSLFDYQRAAKVKISLTLYEYLTSGTEDEQTLSENRSSFKMWYLRPRMLRPVNLVSCRTIFFGEELSMPVFVSPAGVQGLFSEGGECDTARACGRVGTMFGLSQHSTRCIEDVAGVVSAGRGNLWYQSYIMKDRDVTLDLVRRAVKAGYKGIFLTVDSVRFGYREADTRNGFSSLPLPHRLVNYDLYHQKKLSTTYNAETYSSWDQNSEQLFETNLSWNDIQWLKKNACPHLPLVIKGILTPEDALLAIQHGADGIMISNHGGRQLDGCLSSIDALPDIAKAVDGRVPILLDGGVMRGTDVLKALALGATAVGVGKPVFFALAVDAEEGVVDMLRMLKREVENAMALCGCNDVRDIKRDLVMRHPSGGRSAVYTRSKL